jgi:hypothetical protein
MADVQAGPSEPLAAITGLYTDPDGVSKATKVLKVASVNGAGVAATVATPSDPGYVVPVARALTPKGYAQVNAAGTVAVFTIASAYPGATLPVGAIVGFVQAEAQALRWTDDGTDPTTTRGNLLTVGSELPIKDVALSALKFINAAAGAVANINVYA